MLASSQSGAYICLRCQSRAARQFFTASQNSPRSHRYFSNSTLTLTPSSKKSSGRRIYPHGRLRGKKGSEVRESSAVLPVDSLGKPAEIILLRDAALDRPKEEDVQIAEEPEQPKKSSKKDILASVQKATVTVDEISSTRAIDELRDSILGRAPLKGQVISPKDYDKLVRALDEGFTTAQLRQYATKKGSNLLATNGSRGKKLPHSDWTPGITPIDERHLIISRALKRRNVSRGRLAKLIVDRNWQLLPDSASAIGEIDVYDAQSFMQARNEYGTSILDQIAEARHVKMQAINEKVLRITGDRDASMAALKDISRKCLIVVSEKLRLVSISTDKSASASIRSLTSKVTSSSTLESEVDKEHSAISLAARASLRRSDLENLRSTTGANAKFVKDVRGVRHLYLNGYSTEQIDDARRALYSMSNLATRTKHLFLHNTKYQRSSEGSSPNPEALHYHDRGISWHRDEGPTPRNSLETKSADEDLPRDFRELETKIFNSTTAVLSLPVVSNKSPVWKPQLTSEISSHLGFVYWENSAPRTGKSLGPGGLFVPGLAHLSPFLSFLAESSSAVESTRNIITFSFRHDPTPQDRTQNDATKANTAFKWEKDFLPEIKFEFQLDMADAGHGVKAQGEPSLLATYAVIADQNLCTALPDRPIDLCVNEKHICHFDTAASPANMIVSSAIEQMKTSILGESRLRAPPSLDMPIPKSWFTQDRPPLAIYEADLPDSDHLKATYRFVGVEHKQIISFSASQQQYELTTVASGRLGPRYSDLNIVTETAKGEEVYVDEKRKQRLRSAVRQGLDMVGLVDKAAKGLLNFKDVRQLKDGSEQLDEVNVDQSEEGSLDENEAVKEDVLLHQDKQQAAASG